MPEVDAAVAARFWVKVRQGPSGCLLWTAGTYGGGYGRFKIDGKDRPAHRVVFEWLIGAIPDGMQLDHLCRIKRCVNISHLEIVTSKENTLRGIGPAAIHASKTHCPRGHEYSQENTYIRRRGGNRSCKICVRAQVRASYWRRKSKAEREAATA